MKHKLLTLIVLLTTLHAIAQNGTVKVSLIDSNKEPLVGAQLKLTSLTDSSIFFFQTTDLNGNGGFVNIPKGLFQLTASLLGMKTINQEITVEDQAVTIQLQMSEESNSLATVTISARKNLFRQEDDKTIVDPEPLAQSSTNVLEILEKTPGLFVDQDGNVFLNSTTPATIQINGREQRMSATDLAALLKNLPPNSIAKIEILRTPSAKYDANGSGGLVNIVLKKGVKLGRNGSLSANLNKGKFSDQNIGFSLNNSNTKINSYWNSNLGRRNSFEELNTNRQLNSDTTLRQQAYTQLPGQNLYSGYGIGIELPQKWTLSLDGRANIGKSQSETATKNYLLQESNQSVIQNSPNQTVNDNQFFHVNQGLELEKKIDTIGSEFDLDLAYNLHQNQNNQFFTLYPLQLSSVELNGRGNIRNHRHFFQARTDLKYKFSPNTTLETGLKSTLQWFQNSTNFSLIQNGIQSPDPQRTNAFQYTEAIYAGYLQASQTWKGITLKSGLRLENTNMVGKQTIPSDTSFEVHRSDLFPYVYLSRNVFKIAGYDLRAFLVYRKSIARPGYGQLNPFQRFIDQFLYETGNPALQPQFTNNYEINISYDNQPVIAFGKNYTNNLFTNVVYQDPNLKEVAYRTYDNLGDQEESYFKLTGALPQGWSYFFVIGAQYNYLQYKGLYDNQPLQFNRGSWSFFTYHRLKIDGKSTLSLNGFLRLNGLSQFYELSNFGALSANINRRFVNDKLTVTISASDIFFTNRNNFEINQAGIQAWGNRQSDTQRVGINLRYNFGIRKKQENYENYEQPTG